MSEGLVEIRTSERSTFKRCPQKWYWAYVEGLRSSHQANPLWFGSAIHEALADWYRLGLERSPRRPADVFAEHLGQDRALLAPSDNPEEEELAYTSALELGMAMLDNYVDQYGRDEDWDVIATEMEFSMRIKTTFGFTIRYVGTWDGVFRNVSTGEIWLMEHKTTSSINTTHLPLDDQAGSYWALAETYLRKKKIIGPTERVAGIMYNFLKKERLDTRPVNPETGLTCNKPQKKHYAAVLLSDLDLDMTEKQFLAKPMGWMQDLAEREGIVVYGDPSSEQPGTILYREEVYRSEGERKTQIGRIKQEAVYMYNMRIGNPQYPVYKTVSQFSMDACSRCEFFRLCVLDEQGDDMAEEYKESQFIRWDPYEAHHKKG